MVGRMAGRVHRGQRGAGHAEHLPVGDWELVGRRCVFVHRCVGRGGEQRGDAAGVVAVVVRDEACGHCCGLVGEYGEEGAVPEGAAGGGVEEDARGAGAEKVGVCALEGELRCVSSGREGGVGWRWGESETFPGLWPRMRITDGERRSVACRAGSEASWAVRKASCGCFGSAIVLLLLRRCGGVVVAVGVDVVGGVMGASVGSAAAVRALGASLRASMGATQAVIYITDCS